MQQSNTRNINFTSPPVADQKLIRILKRKVFTYDSSAGDERFFRAGIAEFFKSLTYQPWMDNPGSWYKDGTSFKQYLIDIIWERNAQGKTSKYMYFNDRAQRLYLDNTFYEWAVVASRLVYQELKQMGQVQ